MSKRYHDDFPAAPTALVAGLAGACGIPSIVAARVGKDGSVYLDIYQGQFKLNPNHLLDIADFFDIEIEDVEFESGPAADTVTVTVCHSNFDFSLQFLERDRLKQVLPGEEDSEESWEANADLATSRTKH